MREQQSVRLRLRQQIRIWIFASTGTCRPVPVPDSPTQAGSYRHAARRPAGPTGAFRSSEEPTQAGWRTTGKLPVSTGLSPVHLGTGEPTHADSHTGQFRSPPTHFGEDGRLLDSCRVEYRQSTAKYRFSRRKESREIPLKLRLTERSGTVH